MNGDLRRLNRYLAAAKPSATSRMTDAAIARRATGASVISLSAGEPDFDTPDHVREAGIAAIRAGHTRYTQTPGLRVLREAIAAKFKRDNGLDLGWAETIVANGGKHIIFNALAATLNEGDEVLVPAPYWVSYPEIVRLSGAEPIILPCVEDNGFKLTPDQLAAAIGPKTRWVILNSPSNPTGAVYSKGELAALAEVLVANPHVLVLSDDIYEHLIFDGVRFHTIAQVEPRLLERTLTVNGVSKAYAMTGWRIGFGAGPRWLIEAMNKLQGQQTSGACSISQHAALAALTGPQDFIPRSRRAFEERRNFVVRLLDEAVGLKCSVPSGAFYAFVSCKDILGHVSSGGRTLQTDEDVAFSLLEEAGVAVVPGSAFGLEQYFRISFALDEGSLLQACMSIQAFCSSLKRAPNLFESRTYAGPARHSDSHNQS
jgi:aspartate aminotransferase